MDIIECIKSIILLDDANNITLSSGKKSNIYFNKYGIMTNPKLLDVISNKIIDVIKKEEKELDYIAGLEMGSVPLATIISHKLNIPSLFVRKNGELEGFIEPFYKAVLLEDVITTGAQVAKGISALRRNSIIVDNVISIIDRLDGGKDLVSKKNCTLYSLFTIDDF